MSDTPAPRTLDSLLDELRDPLVATVGAERFTPVALRASTIPLDASAFVGFELSLVDARAALDLLLQLAPRSLAHLHAADPDLAATLGGGRELDDLIEALCVPTHPLHGRIDDAWLEYDVGTGDPVAPSVFCHPDDPRDVQRVTELLVGGALGPGVRRTVEALVRALGPSQRIMQAGAMLSRPGRPLRLVVDDTDRSGAADRRLLRHVRWPGDHETVGALLDRYTPLAARHTLAFAVDADGSFAPAVGIEVPCQDPAVAAHLVPLLVRDGAADASLCADALAWNGLGLTTAIAKSSMIVGQLTGGRYKTATVRRLRHVKVSLAPDGAMSAKAYLGAWTVQFRDPRR